MNYLIAAITLCILLAGAGALLWFAGRAGLAVGAFGMVFFLACGIGIMLLLNTGPQ